ncbi:MmcQ/YjbR family DNA-binding protein [Campylobacter sp.]|uniref:MmcQ/YjbR family DNA-binding protein n=1 Tax=Campylobacter sp. TaxID=205 RepID=UPI0027060573|nr:MmcQ/YjbR family DNA-binding protein [Campylobacter sp.]
MQPKTVFEYISDKFGVKNEKVFERYPDHAIFRHEQNAKWFCLLLKVEYKKLGLKKEGETFILNLKCRPDLASLLRDDERIFGAYHMNKKHWISVNLSSDISDEAVFDLIDESYNLTKTAKSKS